MIYRTMFDAVLSSVLKRSGYDTSRMLDFWPTGATPEWVKRGKGNGWKATEAAVVGVSEVAVGRLQAGQISAAEAQLIVMSAHQVALEMRVRGEVLECLVEFTAQTMGPDSG